MKQKRRKTGRRILIALLLIAAAVTASVFAEDSGKTSEQQYRTEVISQVSIDDINIHVENERASQMSAVSVDPGETVSEKISIHNIARPAWIRARLSVNSEDLNGADESMVVLEDKNWKKIGDYYYYTKPAATGDTVPFVDSVRIPTAWASVDARKSFQLSVTAEAVQQDHFTPDFSSNRPWFGTLIELCTHEGYKAPASPAGEGIFDVEFRGGAEGMIHLQEDWNKNWEALMPGDTVKNRATVLNRYNEPVEIWFSIENMGKENEKLLKQLTLSIQKDHETIFEDKLGRETGKISLGSFDYNEGGVLTYSLSAPKELTNEYALESAKTKWIFEARLLKEEKEKPEKTPKTGDPTVILPYAVCLLFSFFMLLFLCRKLRRRPAHEK